MKRFILCNLLSYFAFTGFIAQNASKIYEKVNNSVVKIFTYRGHVTVGQASGVVLKEKGWVVTNFHVLGNADRIVAKHNDTYIETDSILAFDSAKDVLILRLAVNKMAKEVTNAIPNLKFEQAEDLKVGQKVYAIGSPLGLENTMTDGIISGLRTSQSSSQKYVQISAPISPGSSGGAVVNDKGKLIGISTWVLAGKSAQNLNFAVLMDDVLNVARGNIKPDEKADKVAFFDYYFKQAQLDFNRKDYLSSKDNFKKAIQINPKTEYLDIAYKIIGQAFYHLKQPDSAMYYYNKSLLIKPDPELYCSIALIASDRQDFEMALNYYSKALKLNDVYYEALYQSGMIHFNRKDYLNAIIFFNKAVDNHPNEPEALYMMGRMAANKKEWDLGIYFFERAIKSKPDFKDAYLAIITAYTAINDKESVDVYTKKMKLLK